MKKLKRCPLCGGNALLLNPDRYMEDFFINKPIIICQECGLSLENTNKIELMKKWNTRKSITDMITYFKYQMKEFQEDDNYIDAYRYEEAIRLIEEWND